MLTHARKRKNQTTLIIILVAVAFIGALIWLVKKPTSTEATANPAQIQSLAQCLSDKGMKMYGASWCPHCKAQKELFGTAFSKVDYVECTTETVKCNIAGIQGYPTWIYQGQKYEGEQTFEKLAEITGCPYDASK